jgi:hypothetical protein
VIEIKPHIENTFVCPECGSALPEISDVVVQSIHVMADCSCRQCAFRFYQIFPIGHSVQSQLSIGTHDRNVYPGQAEPWLFESVVKACKQSRRDDVAIEKRIFKDCADVIILNTLDFLYGHVLLKLYNALYHIDHQRDMGLILIIPRMFEWLIPPGCAEVWIVDLKLGELAYNYQAIQKFAAHEFRRFRRICLSKAYSHPDFTKIDIARLTGVAPFDVGTFSRRNPQITFVLREDRWWFHSKGDYWFYRLCRKLKVLSWARRILAMRQNRLVRNTMKAIARKLPHADFYVVGLGKTGDFSSYACDERTMNIDGSVETAWCEIYAHSHVVVGVHGSNMLLPTALAAGCVEILPQERYGNMVQDISVRYNDRRQLYFYRFADQYSSSRSVGAKVTAMIEHYDGYHRNMCTNLYH